MRTFDFYILRETVRPLGLALIIAMLVLLIERLLRLLDLMLGAQGPLKLILEILAYLIPHYISLALPMSLLIGVMIAFNRLSRDGELDALQGSGLSLARLSRAPLLMAAAVAIIAGITFGYLKPYGRYAYQAMIYTVGNAALQAFVQPGVFTQFGDTTFLVGAIGREAGSFAEVFVYQDNDDRSTAITARDGTLTRSAEDGTPVLRLFDGVRPPGGGGPPAGCAAVWAPPPAGRPPGGPPAGGAPPIRRSASCASTSCGWSWAMRRRRCSGRAAPTSASSPSSSFGSGGMRRPPAFAPRT